VEYLRTSGINNSITDVNGIRVGNYTDKKMLSGVTVVICDEGAVGGVDVRGSAPGTWETDLLDPINVIDTVNAVTLTGCSAFGLDVGVGVRKWLIEKNYGHRVGATRVPIAPGAVIFDLGRGIVTSHLDIDAGYEACQAASLDRLIEGNVGAGTGAVSGGIKGGLGTASEVMNNGIVVGAIVVVNSAGKIFCPETGGIYARHLELNSEFGKLRSDLVLGYTTYLPSPSSGTNTTIGVVATDAKLTKTQATKVAQMAHDGFARAIYPCHTMGDGDTIFVLATGEKDIVSEQPSQVISQIGATAADVFSRAIIKGVLAAETVGKYKCYKDSFPNSFFK